MSEVTSRSSASRGRGSGRGGRGGFAGRGGRRPNGADKPEHSDSPAAFDDDADLGELRKLYGDKTSVIREMFPDWSEADVLFALQETNGDQSEAVTRIAEGTISQWGEVSKAKKPTRTKAKDTAPAAATTTSEQTTAAPRAARGGRTVSEGGRGRGRATERGGRGGAPRGRTAQPSTNGALRNKETNQLSVPTEESPAFGESKAKAEPVDAKSAPEQPSSNTASITAKTWASMLRQSTAVDKPAPLPGHIKGKPADSAEPTETAPEPVPAPVPEEKTKADEEATPVATHADLVIEEPALPPPKDDLTETNLEQVIDDSQPAATGTAASTAADSWDPRQSPISSTVTPLSAAHQQHQRVPISGYAASALKATTDRTARPPGFQRRVLDQEEAVRMPGNRDLDRAAVQFGAFNLGDGDEDVDGEREDAETRGQPPADSPVAQPRTSLPPPVAQPSAVPDSFPKAAAPSAGTTSQIPTQPAHPAIPGQQYGRYSQEASAQKPIDPFGQQATSVSQPPFDSFSAATTQTPSQGAFSSAPSEYSNYYTANQQERNAYNNYYAQHYGQQQVPHGQHDAQQRPLGGYNAAQADSLSQYPQSGGSHGQPRFGVAADNQNSGHSTPNPAAQTQQQIPQGQQAQPGQQGQTGAPGSQPQGHGQQYPGYNHPYYPYYHQYYSGYGQGNFGPYGGGKGGMYGQPYGVSPNAPYDHASSPANFAPSNAHRDNNASSGLGDYGRGAASQAGSQPGLGATGFGGSHDSFARGGSAFQSQAQGFNSQTQPGSGASAADDLKPFGDGKGAPGPSPSLGGARPGSATNTGPGGQASGLPPQTSQMGGAYGGYPNHLQGHGAHGSGAYGMGAGGAGANQHGNTPYGSYGNQGFGSGGYYGAGQQQQRGGWGGNYH
ncbi:UBA-like protein [Beauveria brongniartii RCEF 3172]|uniref:RNA polymerase II degradation factor 1 n=1 Tax=Beauveria brongniartii RCEF 3172 TaxID=1081107 RepID=A0A166S6P9_9HYPO|nr:UBA-like protein [Beauveria brongniartii RCEF 3172]